METIQILPQKLDGNLVARLSNKVGVLGRIHPVIVPVSSALLAKVLIIETIYCMRILEILNTDVIISKPVSG